MADVKPRKVVLETQAGLPLAWGSRAKAAAWVAGGVALAVVALLVVAAVREGEVEHRWDSLWRISRSRDTDPGAPFASSGPVDVPVRDEHVAKLEELLKTAEGPVAAHAHARIANLQAEQILALADGTFDVRRPRYDSAIHHLRTLIQDHPDSPMVRPDLRPDNFVSEAHRLLATLEKNRAWDEAHAMRDVEPDADPVVLLRTTSGDLRLRFYAKEAPERTRRFLARACAGELDGTHLFGRRDQERETYVWGAGGRSRGDATPPARAQWDEPTQAPALQPEPARDRVLHLRGVVSTWHPIAASEGDPEHVILVTDDSPGLDHRHTPFARATDEASLRVLDRIASVRTFRQEKPDIASDPALREVADQLMTPVKVVKALVYRAGALDPCHTGAVRETEKRLDTVVVDQEVPAAPPPAPPSTPPSSPPSSPGGSDGAGTPEAPPPGAAAPTTPGGAPAGSPDGDGGTAPPADGSQPTR